MAWDLIAHTAKGNEVNSGTTVTTDGVDTTGADTLFVQVSYYIAASPSFTDTYDNEWTPLDAHGEVVAGIKGYVCANPVVGPGHQIMVTGFSPAVCFAAFSGGASSSIVDDQNGNTSGGTPSSELESGEITTAEDGELALAAIAFNESEVTSIDSGFEIIDSIPGVTDYHIGVALARQTLSVAGTANPQWTLATGVSWLAASIVGLKPGATGGPVLPVLVASHKNQGFM